MLSVENGLGWVSYGSVSDLACVMGEQKQVMGEQKLLQLGGDQI